MCKTVQRRKGHRVTNNNTAPSAAPLPAAEPAKDGLRSVPRRQDGEDGPPSPPSVSMTTGVRSDARAHCAAQSAHMACALTPPGCDDRACLDRILELIHQRHACNFSQFRQDMLISRIRHRMGLHGLQALPDYLRMLDSDPNEGEALFKVMLIGVSVFFRDPEAWEVLYTDVLVPMVATAPAGATLRVWVPACSTGEEAYSVAILILDALRRAEKQCPLLVFATDINEDALQQARRGIYPAEIKDHVAADLLARYFVPCDPDGRYQLSTEVRDCVVFGVQNAISDPPVSRVDLICCRNLLIYLETSTQQALFSSFDFALNPGGHLFLGCAETPGEHADLFVPVSRKWRIYRHRERCKTSGVPMPTRSDSWSATAPGAKTPPAREEDVASLTRQLLQERFSPAAVLVSTTFETRYFCGPTENFLQMPRGAPTLDVLAQAREGLRSRLGCALRQALKEGTTVTVDDARVRDAHGYRQVRFSVVPVAGPDESGCRYLLVVFENAGNPPASAKSAGDPQVKQLEGELRATRDDLQSVIERLATSNEELKISNEEVAAMNAELQSANEELEISRDGLKSLNEALNGANRTLQDKVAELQTSNADIRNLLASSEIATVCIDREFRIKWLTPSMKSIGNIIATDIGRPIADFSTAGLGSGIIDEATQVLKDLQSVQTEFKSQNEHWYLRRIIPYRTEHHHIGGVVITYSDITEARISSEHATAAMRSMATSLEQRVRERTAQLRTLMAELALSEERERRLLARDLHDDLAQTLAIVKIKLTSLEGSERRGVLKAALSEMEGLIDQAHRSVRSLMLHLSPPILGTLGLVPALEWLSEEMERLYGLAVSIEREDDLPVLEEPARTTIFRAIRELLINVSKHADTNVASIDCHRQEGNRISITVTDQGRGFDYETAVSCPAGESGFGLISVRERIEFIGGDMEVSSRPGAGATIRIIFPARRRDTIREGQQDDDSNPAGGRSQDSA
ncbi:MAG: hypothetical protein CVU19_11015 [Betaproteobacteria bacterium HGW-Betaproteobacteria-13]|nr:MAG: hypothetical protein CVU19_11015 [Betaproteobacteria bacterium HGW-Betaproteobacteria-13]